jgi:3-phenylpropionate/cinnamic acid dioxygenase small subunit
LEDEKPVIRVGNQFFQGELEEIHGTAVCFQVQQDNDDQTSTKRPKSKLSYVGKTDKCFMMKRVFLNPKNGGDSVTTEKSNSTNNKPGIERTPGSDNT